MQQCPPVQGHCVLGGRCAPRTSTHGRERASWGLIPELIFYLQQNTIMHERKTPCWIKYCKSDVGNLRPWRTACRLFQRLLVMRSSLMLIKQKPPEQLKDEKNDRTLTSLCSSNTFVNDVFVLETVSSMLFLVGEGAVIISTRAVSISSLGELTGANCC